MANFNHILAENPERKFREEFYFNPLPPESDPAAILHCAGYYESVFLPGVRLDDFVGRPFTAYIKVISGVMGDPDGSNPAGTGCFVICRFRNLCQPWASKLREPLVRRGVLISNTRWHTMMLDAFFPGDMTVFPPDETGEIDRILEEIKVLVSGDSGAGLRLESLLFQLIQTLHRHQSEERLPEELVRAMDFINTHLMRSFSREETAEYASLSVSTLTRLFRKYLRCSPAAYTAKVRMEYARGLLSSPRLSLKMIAFQSGFPSQAYFSGQFKKFYGVTPSEFRQGKKKQPSAGGLPG